MTEPEAAVADPARLIAASRPLSEPPNYDGVLFSAVRPGPEHAIGHYHQDGDLITVEIGSGNVRTGRLVGTVDSAGVLQAAYCMVLGDGEVIAGRCVSTPSLLPDGRLLLTEQWSVSTARPAPPTSHHCRNRSAGRNRPISLPKE